MAFDAGTIEATATINKGDFIQALADLKAMAAKGITVPLKFDTSGSGLAGSIASAKAAAQAIAGSGVSIPLNYSVNPASVASAIAAQKTVAAAVTKAAGGAGIGGGKPGGWGTGLTSPGGGGWLGFLTGRVGLFGASATSGFSVANWHLLADAVVETVAIVGPALIALGVFSAGAAANVGDIITQMKNLNTISLATGATIPPLSGALSKLQDAVKPQVYQLFGDAIQVMNNKSGEFQTLAVGTGHALDNLGSRLTMALTSGNGFGQFLKNAVPDVAKVGDVVGNLGGTLGNVFKAVPGYANIFLNLVDALSKGAEALTGLAVPLVNAGLWLHGLFIYGGLAVTALSAIYRSAASSGGVLNTWGLAIFGAGKYLARVGGDALFFAKTMGLGAGATSLWVDTLGKIPGWGWAIAGVVALGALFIALAHIKDATQNYYDTLQKGIMNSSISQVGFKLIVDQTLASEKLAQAHQDLAAAQQHIVITSAAAGKGFSFVTTNVGAATQAYAENLAGNKQIDQQTIAYSSRMTSLAKIYGSVNAAQGLLVTSGISVKQLLTDTPTQWHAVMQQIDATVLGYQAMGLQSGQTARDLGAINAVTNDQYNAILQVNQAWTTYLGLTTDLGSGSVAALTQIHNMTQQMKAAGASFTGVNANALILQQTFYNSLVPSIQKTITAMQQAHDPVKNLANVVATLLNPSVKDGALKSDVARQAIFKLAQEAGYAGPNQVKPLRDWIDKYREALSKIPKSLLTHIGVTASGTWSINQAGVISGPHGPTQGHHLTAAAGAFVRSGSGPTSDDVIARVSHGELIVPSNMVAAGLVNHLRGSIPGFAGGGVVGNFNGNPPGLGLFSDREFLSTNRMVEVTTAAATAAALRAAKAQSQQSFFAAGGPGGGSASANAALARRMMPAWSTGELWSAWNYLEMREAGWNQYAQNKSSGAYGIPQALPPTKMPFAAQAAGGSNPAAQIGWMIGYIQATYNNPINAAAHEAALSWYDKGGMLKSGGIGINRSGMPEAVLSPTETQMFRQLVSGLAKGGGNALIGTYAPVYHETGSTARALGDLVHVLQVARQQNYLGVLT